MVWKVLSDLSGGNKKQNLRCCLYRALEYTLMVKNSMNGKDDTFAEVIGYFPFENLKVGDVPYSANHIDYKNNYLFVASGVGGVNIYYLH